MSPPYVPFGIRRLIVNAYKPWSLSIVLVQGIQPVLGPIDDAWPSSEVHVRCAADLFD